MFKPQHLDYVESLDPIFHRGELHELQPICGVACASTACQPIYARGIDEQGGAVRFEIDSANKFTVFFRSRNRAARRSAA